MQITILGKGRVPFQVDAMATQNPNLVVHLTPFEKEGLFGALVPCWSISHVPSGMSVFCCLPTRETALAVAAWLTKQHIDWTLARPDVPSGAPRLKHELGKINDFMESYMESVIGIFAIIGHPLVKITTSEVIH
jgi:hypothetical protein